MLLAQTIDRPFEPRARCWLEFSLPDSGAQIKARAEVVRQMQRGRYHLIAVRFRTLAPSHRRAISRYVEQPPPWIARPFELPHVQQPTRP